MGFADSVSRLISTFVAVLQTRAELAAVEVEEEALRYFTYLMMALAAMFFAGIALLLVIFLVVAIFWDTHRIAVLLTLIVLFGLGAGVLGMKLRDRYRQKPSLLGHTLKELSRDVEAIRGPSKETQHVQHGTEYIRAPGAAQA